MPRRSANELQIVPISRAYKRIEAPPGLTQPEATLFHEIVNASPALAFTQSDARLLVAYVQSILLCQTAFDAAMASPDCVRDWERAARVMADLARSLRLTPHARTDPKVVARGIMRRDLGLDPETLASVRGWQPKA